MRPASASATKTGLAQQNRLDCTHRSAVRGAVTVTQRGPADDFSDELFVPKFVDVCRLPENLSDKLFVPLSLLYRLLGSEKPCSAFVRRVLLRQFPPLADLRRMGGTVPPAPWDMRYERRIP